MPYYGGEGAQSMSLYQEQPWILTHTGKRVNLQNPQAEDVCLEDIAYALARLNRFTGHADPSWSVGQHSLFCAELARLQGGSLELQRSCLSHDFAEAYLGDVSSPLKRCIQGYHGLEVLHFHAICTALGIDLGVDPGWNLDPARAGKVKAIDQRAFEVEVQTFMPGHPDLPAMMPPTEDERRAFMRPLHYRPDRVERELTAWWLELKYDIEEGK